MSQNLDTMSVAKRNSLLVAMAKEVVLKYGPDYYREDFPPVIERHMVPPKGEISKTGEMASRVSYLVTFLYDSAFETMAWDYAAKVSVWEDTGDLIWVMFGNGVGRIIPEDIDWRTDTSIEPVRYQDATVPIYGITKIMIPESVVGEREKEEFFQQAIKNLNPEPENKDELIRKGWVKNSDGQWVKTTPDVPPSRRMGL